MGTGGWWQSFASTEQSNASSPRNGVPAHSSASAVLHCTCTSLGWLCDGGSSALRCAPLPLKKMRSVQAGTCGVCAWEGQGGVSAVMAVGAQEGRVGSRGGVGAAMALG